MKEIEKKIQEIIKFNLPENLCEIDKEKTGNAIQRLISTLLKKERQKMGKFLLKYGHGGGNWRRLIISEMERE